MATPAYMAVMHNCQDPANAHFTHLENVHFTYRKITWNHEVSGTSCSDQTHSSLHIDGLTHDCQVLAFNGSEIISQTYAIDLELVSERATLDLETRCTSPPYSAFQLLTLSGIK